MTGRTQRRFTVEHVSDFQYGEIAQGSLVVLRLRPREDNGQPTNWGLLLRRLHGCPHDCESPAGKRVTYMDLRSCMRPVDAIAHRKDRWP